MRISGQPGLGRPTNERGALRWGGAGRGSGGESQRARGVMGGVGLLLPEWGAPPRPPALPSSPRAVVRPQAPHSSPHSPPRSVVVGAQVLERLSPRCLGTARSAACGPAASPPRLAVRWYGPRRCISTTWRRIGLAPRSPAL